MSWWEWILVVWLGAIPVILTIFLVFVLLSESVEKVADLSEINSRLKGIEKILNRRKNESK